uniref:Lipocalin-6 1 n=2 Tax=Amblyomma maculatum TaxID=34609 RepID=G3MRJ8_AMBMU
MRVVAAFILCMCIRQAFASEGAADKPKCENPTRRTDGYSLFEPDSIFHLRRTTFAIQANDTYRCISANTIEKDDEMHEVTLTVEYSTEGSSEREGYSQRFQFRLEGGSDSYNLMESTGTIGAPYGIYKFLSTEAPCIILEAKDYQLPKDESVGAEARNADKDTKAEMRGRCMLWQRDGQTSGPDNCCLHMFSELCPHEDVRQGFSNIECPSRQDRNAPDDQVQGSSK